MLIRVLPFNLFLMFSCSPLDYTRRTKRMVNSTTVNRPISPYFSYLLLSTGLFLLDILILSSWSQHVCFLFLDEFSFCSQAFSPACSCPFDFVGFLYILSLLIFMKVIGFSSITQCRRDLWCGRRMFELFADGYGCELLVKKVC